MTGFAGGWATGCTGSAWTGVAVKPAIEGVALWRISSSAWWLDPLTPIGCPLANSVGWTVGRGAILGATGA